MMPVVRIWARSEDLSDLQGRVDRLESKVLEYEDRLDRLNRLEAAVLKAYSENQDGE